MLKKSLLICAALTSAAAGFCAPPDNGVPTREAGEWNEIWNPTTGSHWRTKKDESTGEEISFDPFTSYIWRNPNTGNAEAILREPWTNNDAEQKQAEQEAGDSLLSTDGQTPDWSVATMSTAGGETTSSTVDAFRNPFPTPNFFLKKPLATPTATERGQVEAPAPSRTKAQSSRTNNAKAGYYVTVGGRLEKDPTIVCQYIRAYFDGEKVVYMQYYYNPAIANDPNDLYSERHSGFSLEGSNFVLEDYGGYARHVITMRDGAPYSLEEWSRDDLKEDFHLENGQYTGVSVNTTPGGAVDCPKQMFFERER